MLVREFQASDRFALIEISKRTWGGHDQLPYELDKLMANPNSHLFVLEHKEHLVAFANISVIDEGKTGWLEHMRVHWRYRKRGFAWAMTQFLITKAEELGVKRLRLSATLENEATRKIATRLGMNQVPLMKLFIKGNFRGIRWKDTSIPIEPCTPDEAYTILGTHSSLIPQGVLTDYWHVYDFTKSNFDSIQNQFQFWKAEKHGKTKALVFGYQRFFHKNSQWCATIYALNLPSFYSTLSHQLQTAKALQAQSVLCFHSLPFQAGGEIPGLKQNTFSTTLVLYEKYRPFLSSR
jgi:RimJ/RimL family protein N-acetyltransferase